MAQAVTAPTEGVDVEWAHSFGERWGEAWNSHDPERVLSLMTEDIVYDDSAWPTTMRGHADVREFLDWTWRAMPDLTFEVVEGPFMAPDEPKAAVYWRGRATVTGPLDPPGFAPTNTSVEFEGADFHEYRDGKVARLRIVFDMLEVGQQIGALPPQGSFGERLATIMQRMQARRMRRRGAR
jgi:steroid delta-isomerase-like uncharacterized protein